MAFSVAASQRQRFEKTGASGIAMAVLVVNLDGRLLGRRIKAATFRARKSTFVCQVCSSKRVLLKKCFDEEIDDWVYDPIKVIKCIILKS